MIGFAMNHLHIKYEEVLRMPIVHLNLLIRESTPHYTKKKKDTVTMETYWGTVEAKKRFII
jgi:hypothetical protein